MLVKGSLIPESVVFLFVSELLKDPDQEFYSTSTTATTTRRSTTHRNTHTYIYINYVQVFIHLYSWTLWCVSYFLPERRRRKGRKKRKRGKRTRSKFGHKMTRNYKLSQIGEIVDFRNILKRLCFVEVQTLFLMKDALILMKTILLNYRKTTQQQSNFLLFVCCLLCQEGEEGEEREEGEEKEREGGEGTRERERERERERKGKREEGQRGGVGLVYLDLVRFSL